MCVILDASIHSKFADVDNHNMAQLRKWLLQQDGSIAYSDGGKLYREQCHSSKYRTLFEQLRDNGKANLVPYKDIKVLTENRLKPLQDGNKRGAKPVKNPWTGDKITALESDDAHVIALAIHIRGNLLVADDEKLENDFRNHKILPNGSIYKHNNTAQNQLLIDSQCKKAKCIWGQQQHKQQQRQRRQQRRR